MQTLKKMTGSRYLPDSVKSRLNGICLKRGYHQMDEFAVELDAKQLRKIRHFGVNLYGLLRAKYIHADRERVTFLIEEPLPDCKMVMLSATVCWELYQKVYPNRAIDFHECPKAEYKGHIFQYTDSSYSRYAFQNDYDKIRLLKELCRDTTVITFKDIEKEFQTHYHFGNVEGINALKGKDLSVVGLPNLDEVVYGLYAMRAGEVWQKCICTRRESPIRTSRFFSTPTRTKRSGWCRPGCCPPSWNRRWDVRDCCGKTAGCLSMPDSRWNRQNI